MLDGGGLVFLESELPIVVLEDTEDDGEQGGCVGTEEQKRAKGRRHQKTAKCRRIMPCQRG